MQRERVFPVESAGAAAPDRPAPASLRAGWEGRLRRLRRIDIAVGLLAGLATVLVVAQLAIVGLVATLALAVCALSSILTRRRRSG